MVQAGLALVCASGLIVALWALLGDWARRGWRRARCPKCWYDMEGVPTVDGVYTCPECGAKGGTERWLHRSRRRWTWVALGVLMAAACASPRATLMWKHGWRAGVPTWAVVRMVDPQKSQAYEAHGPASWEQELASRVFIRRDGLNRDCSVQNPPIGSLAPTP
jgi:hypothetical protein